MGGATKEVLSSESRSHLENEVARKAMELVMEQEVEATELLHKNE